MRSTLPKLVTFVFALVATLAGLAAAAAPTDNPVAGWYSGPEGYPGWTDRVAWANVTDMKEYAKGANDFQKFENARDELAAKGGGVLYYPAGTYDFRDMPGMGPGGRGLMLRSGVVIRGEAPAKGDVDTRSGKLELKTRFVFPMKDRSDVALDTGLRARMMLRGVPAWIDSRTGKNGEVTKTRGSDTVYLSIDAGGGEWKPAGLIASHDRVREFTPEVSVKQEGGKWVLSIKGECDYGKVKRNFTVEASVAADGKTLKGTFKGKCDDMDVDGPIEGRLEEIVPKTPVDWNVVGLMPEPGKRIKDVDMVGVCWVSFVGATIYFGPDVSWGETWEKAGSWKSGFAKEEWKNRKPDGTHPMDPFCGGGKEYVGVGKGRLVMGCKFDQSAQVNNAMTCGVTHPTAKPDGPAGFGENGFHTAKFGARVAVYGSDVLVAVNVLPMSEGQNFKYRQTTIRPGGAKGNDIRFEGTRPSTVLFDYNKTCGIDINKDMLGLVRGQVALPASNEGYYEPGVVIRDNWVYNYGHKGYNVSGRWMTLTNNVNERMVLTRERCPYFLGGWRLTLDGFIEVSGGGGGSVSDTLSRAFDLGGQSLWIDGSYFRNTGSEGNDGEGILCQAHGGTDIYSWGITRNKHEKGVGSNSYIAGWAVLVHGCLIAWNETAGFVGQVNPSDAKDEAYVGNKAASVSTGKNTSPILEAPSGKPTPPKGVKLAQEGRSAIMVSWEGVTENAIGYRVDRSLDAGKTWATIAYRPPQVQQSPDNPRAWADFTLPLGKPAVYRVVAVNGADNLDGASEVVGPITLK